MRGGEVNLNEIEGNLKTIQQQVNDALDSIKASQTTSSTSDFMSDYNNEPSIEPTSSTTSYKSDMTSDYNNEPSVPTSIPKPWQDDKNVKFSDCCRGRVSLSFPRIMMLLQGNINKGNKTKDWSGIKEKLLDATSISEVNSVIKQSNINFSSNSVYGGTKKRRRGGKRRTHRRH